MALDVELLNETFQRAKRENGGLTSLGMRFYQRLFEKYPGVKPLFHTPPEEQHKKLMASVASIVASVNTPEKMLPYLRAMAVRHLQYKTESAHYAAVSENLVAVLGEHLSKEGKWTPEMKAGWEEALNTVSAIMIEAAENPDRYREELVQAGYQPDGFKASDDEPWNLMATAVK